MDLAHRFAVPTPVEETWAHFQDIASVAECFPGAQVTSAEGDSFSGTAKVKLGAIALVYNGSGTFVELLDAQVATLLAEFDYVNVIYDYHKALATLEQAVGQPLR